MYPSQDDAEMRIQSDRYFDHNRNDLHSGAKLAAQRVKAFPERPRFSFSSTLGLKPQPPSRIYTGNRIHKTQDSNQGTSGTNLMKADPTELQAKDETLRVANQNDEYKLPWAGKVIPLTLFDRKEGSIYSRTLRYDPSSDESTESLLHNIRNDFGGWQKKNLELLAFLKSRNYPNAETLFNTSASHPTPDEIMELCAWLYAQLDPLYSFSEPVDGYQLDSVFEKLSYPYVRLQRAEPFKYLNTPTGSQISLTLICWLKDLCILSQDLKEKCFKDNLSSELTNRFQTQDKSSGDATSPSNPEYWNSIIQVGAEIYFEEVCRLNLCANSDGHKVNSQFQTELASAFNDTMLMIPRICNDAISSAKDREHQIVSDIEQLDKEKEMFQTFESIERDLESDEMKLSKYKSDAPHKKEFNQRAIEELQTKLNTCTSQFNNLQADKQKLEMLAKQRKIPVQLVKQLLPQISLLQTELDQIQKKNSESELLKNQKNSQLEAIWVEIQARLQVIAQPAMEASIELGWLPPHGQFSTSAGKSAEELLGLSVENLLRTHDSAMSDLTNEAKTLSNKEAVLSQQSHREENEDRMLLNEIHSLEANVKTRKERITKALDQQRTEHTRLDTLVEAAKRANEEQLHRVHDRLASTIDSLENSNLKLEAETTTCKQIIAPLKDIILYKYNMLQHIRSELGRRLDSYASQSAKRLENVTTSISRVRELHSTFKQLSLQNETLHKTQEIPDTIQSLLSKHAAFIHMQ